MPSQASKFDQFEDTIRTDVHTAVSLVIQSALNKVLTGQQLADLSTALQNAYPKVFCNSNTPIDDPGYGADFDIASEINDQIRVVRALRSTIVDEDGSLKDGIAPREAKEMISAGSTMLASLMKFHEKVINQDRMRAVETATIDTIKTLPEQQQDDFFAALESALATIT